MIEGGQEEASHELMKIMISVLGQRTGHLKEPIPDDKPDQNQTSNVKLYQYEHFNLFGINKS